MRKLWKRWWAWRAHRHFVLSERDGRRAGLGENP